MKESLDKAYQGYCAAVTPLISEPWRQGRRQPKNVYLVLDDDWEQDHEIAVFMTPELAAAAVKAHNATRLTLLR